MNGRHVGNRLMFPSSRIRLALSLSLSLSLSLTRCKRSLPLFTSDATSYRFESEMFLILLISLTSFLPSSCNRMKFTSVRTKWEICSCMNYLLIVCELLPLLMLDLLVLYVFPSPINMRMRRRPAATNGITTHERYIILFHPAAVKLFTIS